MSVAADAAGQPLRAGPALLAVRRALLHGRLPVYLGCTALALVVSYLLGKEMAWDTLNYHMYVGFSAMHGRLDQDYFAAGPQSYINPYAYVPFYALVSSGLPALLVASVLAAVHSVILWLTFELALLVFPGSDSRRVALAICATVLAAANPVLIQQIGASFADITTGELVLAGWLLLATAVRTPSSTRVICAGLLLGAATALKMTNAVHAIAAAALLIMLPRPLAVKLRYGALYGCVTGAAFALVAAPWAYRLEGKFGNPFFPLLNNIFRSPQFTTEPLRHLRFIPSGLGEALWRPFAMLDPMYMVHEELMAPDARYAVLCVLICAYAVRWLWRPRGRSLVRVAGETRVDTRVLMALSCGFGVDWVLWLVGSGNSRYFIPMACVCSVLVIGLLLQLLPSAPKARAYILGVLAATQAFQLSWGTELRWTSVPWDGGKWFEIEVPASLRTEPALYLAIGIQSDSFIAPYLAKDAAFVDFSGGYPLTSAGANGAQVEALIRKHASHLRMLIRGARLYADAERRAPSASQVDSALARFGLRVDPADCAQITVHGLPHDLEPTFASSTPVEPQPRDTTYVVSCRVVPDHADHSAEMARQRQADLVLDRLEDACPALFQPRRVPTDTRGLVSRRLYMNTDVVAWVSLGWVKFQEPLRGDDMVVLGRESDWLTAPVPLACGRRQGHYFAQVLDSTDTRQGQ